MSIKSRLAQLEKLHKPIEPTTYEVELINYRTGICEGHPDVKRAGVVPVRIINIPPIERANNEHKEPITKT